MECLSPDSSQRFAGLLRQADTQVPLTEERLVELQILFHCPVFIQHPRDSYTIAKLPIENDIGV